MTQSISDQTIVIADDEPFILQAYEEGLQRAGFTILVASEGESALKLIREHKPDLVLLDLVMPKLNGFEVLKEMKTDKKLNQIPVIIVSNLSKATDEKQVRSLGAVDFVVKSDYSLKDVLGIVKRTISTIQKSRPKSIRSKLQS